ncbi:MAG: hypothetical protein ACYC8S_02330 [Minisyncoccota bacterium]
MAKGETAGEHDVPLWKYKEITITKKIVLQWKIKTEKFLHCNQCRAVLTVGCVAVKTTTKSRVVLSETAKKSPHMRQEGIFCSARCGRLYLLDHMDSSISNPLRLLPVLDDNDEEDSFVGEIHREMSI